MSKKIHTIQSSDKKEFDKTVNQFLESGCELMDGGYEVINSDDGLIYSQVIVLKNCDVAFHNEEQQLKWVENRNEDGERDGLNTTWYENGQKRTEITYKDGKEDGLSTWWYQYENGQKRWEGTYKDGKKEGLFTNWYENGQKSDEYTFKGDSLISQKNWNEDGSVR